jgi:hypothetical protein
MSRPQPLKKMSRTPDLCFGSQVTATYNGPIYSFNSPGTSTHELRHQQLIPQCIHMQMNSSSPYNTDNEKFHTDKQAYFTHIANGHAM